MPESVVPGVWLLEANLEVSGSKWRNSIHIAQHGTGPYTAPATTAAIVDAYKTFILNLHFPDTTLDSLTLRDCIQIIGDAGGVETPAIWTLGVNTVGNANTTFGGAHFSGSLPKSAALFVKKSASSGRAGKMYMRNILTEADVQSALSGEWTFSDHAGGWQTSVFNDVVNANLLSFFTDPPGTENYYIAVMHLLHLKAEDTRVPVKSVCTNFTAERPVWNKASR